MDLLKLAQLRMKPLLFFCSAMFLVVSVASGEMTFEDLFYVSPSTAQKSLGAERVGMLQAALEDFNAVLSFKPPIHAKYDKDVPSLADGGTATYKARGYQITVVKSIFVFGDSLESGVAGYMYGPAIAPGPELGAGNFSNITRTSFYPNETLNKLLKKNSGAK